MQTVPAKKIVTRNKNTAWFGCDYTMNLYRGCCHGCIYCDSRSDCYHIENFDTVCAKQDALRIVRDDLARYVKPGVIATGAMSDPYNPFEAKENLTRNALELINAYEYGVAIDTKSNLITRDIDVLRTIKEHSPVLCKITITTPHDKLAAKLEPNVASPSQRFTAVQQLACAGIFTGILLMPVLPFLEDDEHSILELVHQASQNGARFIYPYFGVTLRTGQREYFYRQLDKAFPEQNYATKYRSRFGNQYHCASQNSKQLWQTFTDACHQTGLLYQMRDIVAAYRQGYGSRQLSFL